MLTVGLAIGKYAAWAGAISSGFVDLILLGLLFYIVVIERQYGSGELVLPTLVLAGVLAGMAAGGWLLIARAKPWPLWGGILVSTLDTAVSIAVLCLLPGIIEAMARP